MRRPYRPGDTFAIPIAGGRTVRGVVLDGDGAVAAVALLDEDGAPQVVARTSDRGLILNRWPLTGRLDPFHRGDWPAPESRLVDAAETLADRARALAEGRTWVRARIVVRDGAMLEPPPNPRLYRRIGRRSEVLHARDAARSGAVAMDLAGVTLVDPAALAAAAGLRVLRLDDVRFGDDLGWLASLPLTHLYLSGVYRAPDLLPLARMPALRQLEVRDAWQFHVRELDWAAVFGHLESATLDLGSRRKNAELYRAFAPPYPEPFERVVAALRPE